MTNEPASVIKALIAFTQALHPGAPSRHASELLLRVIGRVTGGTLQSWDALDTSENRDKLKLFREAFRLAKAEVEERPTWYVRRSLVRATRRILTFADQANNPQTDVDRYGRLNCEQRALVELRELGFNAEQRAHIIGVSFAAAEELLALADELLQQKHDDKYADAFAVVLALFRAVPGRPLAVAQLRAFLEGDGRRRLAADLEHGEELRELTDVLDVLLPRIERRIPSTSTGLAGGGAPGREGPTDGILAISYADHDRDRVEDLQDRLQDYVSSTREGRVVWKRDRVHRDTTRLVLQEIFKMAAAYIVTWGGDGPGPAQRSELEVIRARCGEDGARVVVVILDDAGGSPPRLDRDLEGCICVDLRIGDYGENLRRIAEMVLGGL